MQIKADTDEVTRSNAEREKEAERMRKNMRSSLQSYEVMELYLTALCIHSTKGLTSFAAEVKQSQYYRLLKYQ